jgi:hypothetical protein
MKDLQYRKSRDLRSLCEDRRSPDFNFRKLTTSLILTANVLLIQDSYLGTPGFTTSSCLKSRPSADTARIAIAFAGPHLQFVKIVPHNVFLDCLFGTGIVFGYSGLYDVLLFEVKAFSEYCEDGKSPCPAQLDRLSRMYTIGATTISGCAFVVGKQVTNSRLNLRFICISVSKKKAVLPLKESCAGSTLFERFPGPVHLLGKLKPPDPFWPPQIDL